MGVGDRVRRSIFSEIVYSGPARGRIEWRNLPVYKCFLTIRPPRPTLRGTMKLPVYLDHHATTPCDPRVVEAMIPWLSQRFGNPASRSHSFGWEAEEGINLAREDVARLIGARPKEIVFTSGATESNNLALKGVVQGAASGGRHIISCVTEHRAILDPLDWLAGQGTEVTCLEVDGRGHIDVDRLRESIRENTVLVSLMAANNETGLLHPLREIGAVTREAGVLFHTDAAQAAGRIPIDVEEMNIDLLSLSGHKIYGPKGVGALYVRRRNPRVRLALQLHGGGHERGMRSGTLNVPGIVALGKACSLSGDSMAEESGRLGALRDRLEKTIMDALDEVYQNGDPVRRLPGSLNLSFAFIDGETLLMGMEDLAVSPGSACSSGAHEASYVLEAIGTSRELARSSLRFGLGRFTTEEEIDFAAGRVIDTVRRLRRFSPLYRTGGPEEGAGTGRGHGA